MVCLYISSQGVYGGYIQWKRKWKLLLRVSDLRSRLSADLIVVQAWTSTSLQQAGFRVVGFKD